jgi:hypothetical protein
MPEKAPKILFAKPVLKELRSLSPSDASQVAAFIEHLAENPYDRTVLDSADARGDVFTSSVNDKLYVYWSFDPDEEISPDPDVKPRIKILGLGRKTTSRGRVALLR